MGAAPAGAVSGAEPSPHATTPTHVVARQTVATLLRLSSQDRSSSKVPVGYGTRVLPSNAVADRSLPPSLARLVDRGASLVTLAPAPGAARDVTTLARDALARPVGAPRLRELARGARRVVAVVSDATRDEPRLEMLRAVREELPDARITVVVASGTHAPRDASTVLDAEALGLHDVVVHDGSREDAMVDLGVTPRGTPVRVNRVVAEADVVVSTGRIRPHYFAGMSGGAKGVFPGCGLSVDVRKNHLLKAHPSARLGALDGNECRLDMEDAVRRVPGKVFVLNVVADCDGRYQSAHAGDLVLAHRAAAEVAAPLFTVRAKRRSVVVTSDLPPVTDSLYQASKLLPPAGALLLPGGTAVMVAACPEGTGPLQTVNEGIYRLGVRLALPEGHRVRLVSDMSEEMVRTTYATPVSSVDEALREVGADPRDVTVLFRAGEMIAIAD